LKARNEITELEGVPEQFDIILDNISINGNPQGLEKGDRTMWFEEQAEKFSMNGNSILYWAGCTTAYRVPEVVESTTSVLDKLGLDFGMQGVEEGCCGLILYLTGQWGEAEENALEVMRMVGGVETLVTGCAGCYYTFSYVYNELGVQVPFKVLHTSQLLDLVLEERKLKPLKGDFMWHDPCDLGRHSGVYQPPREVLRRIPDLNLVEYPLNMEHTVCCGAGGGLWTFREELTDHVSHQKMMVTVPKGVDGVITGCPTCLLSIRNTARVHRPGMKVFDLTEVVDSCL
jgi:Fe-S oxidoreductase